MVKIWKIAAKPIHEEERTKGNVNKYIEFSTKNNFIAIGWHVSNLKGKSIKEIAKELEINNEPPIRAKEHYIFANNIEVGDIILHYKGNFLIHNVGRVIGPYYYIESLEMDMKNIHANVKHRIPIEWISINGKKNDFEADFHNWQDTVHEFNLYDLDKIKDRDLKEFLKNELRGVSTNDTIAEAAKKVLEKTGKALELKEIYNGIIGEGLYNFGALDPISALRIALERRCNNVSRSDAPTEKWFIRYSDQVYGLIEWENKRSIFNAKEFPKNLILYGPPGTGKTFITKRKAVEIIENV